MAGKIETLVETVLKAIAPHGYIGTTELCCRVYGVGTDQVEKRHRVSVLRAAHRLLDRNPQFDKTGDMRTNEVLFFDGTSAEARFSAAFSNYRWGYDALLERFGDYLKPGGLCYDRAQISKARVAGDHERVKELEAEAKRRREAAAEAITLRLGAAMRGGPPADDVLAQAGRLLRQYFKMTGSTEAIYSDDEGSLVIESRSAN